MYSNKKQTLITMLFIKEPLKIKCNIQKKKSQSGFIGTTHQNKKKQTNKTQSNEAGQYEETYSNEGSFFV